MCGNVVVTGGVATFTCSGLTEEQAKLLNDIPALLTKLLTQTKDLSSIKDLLNTSVAFHHGFSLTEFDSESKATLIVKEAAVPEINMAKDLRVVAYIFPVRKEFRTREISDQVDKAFWNHFVQVEVPSMKLKAPTSNIQAGWTRQLVDYSLPLSRNDIDDMKHFRLRIYIATAAWWKNVSGSRDSAAECVFLGSDISPDNDPYNIEKMPPLHICPSSPEDF